jgi:F0F1-type ATP synthase assembly protein I
MTRTKAPKKTLSPRDDNKSSVKVGNQSAVFISLALDMSWRLAFAVLVPIIGGFELDKQLKTTPLLTIMGFVIAMLGMALVLWRTLQVANQAAGVNKDRIS